MTSDSETDLLLQEPLIWTAHGNMPVSALRYVTLWEDTPNMVQFVEEYYLGDELVRRNVHNYARSMT